QPASPVSTTPYAKTAQNGAAPRHFGLNAGICEKDVDTAERYVCLVRRGAQSGEIALVEARLAPARASGFDQPAGLRQFVRCGRHDLKRRTHRSCMATTYANRQNLAPSFFEHIIAKYKGTRLGRQELMGDILDSSEGALWTRDMLEAARDGARSEYVRIVVAVD